MANYGYFESATFNGGCYFQIRWEQIKYGTNYSILVFDLYLTVPKKIKLYDIYGHLYLKALPETIKEGSSLPEFIDIERNLTVEFGGNVSDEAPYIFPEAGTYLLGNFTSYASTGIRPDSIGEAYKYYHNLNIDNTVNSSLTGEPYTDIEYYVDDSSSYISYRTEPNLLLTDSKKIEILSNEYPYDLTVIGLNNLSSTRTAGNEDGVIYAGTPINPTKITCRNGYIGDYVDIFITPYAQNLKHTISYHFGSLFGNIAEKTADTNINWQIPTSFLNEIPNNNSYGECSLSCYSYDEFDALISVSSTTFYAFMDVNGEGPVFNPEVYDINSTTLALTGNKDILVRYYSTAECKSNAIAKNNATIVSQKITCGPKEISNSTGNGVITNVESGVFSFTATDNRGAIGMAQITKTLIPYTKVSSNIFNVKMDSHGDLSFRIEGNFFNESFGAVNNKLVLKYKLDTDENYTVIEPTISGHNYVADVVVYGLNYSQTYTIEAIATDKLSSDGAGEYYKIVGKPIFDWSKNDFNFNVPIMAQRGVEIAPDQAIYGYDEGNLHEALVPLDSTGDTVLGRGGYLRNLGDTKIYGTNVDIMAHEDITINGKSLLNQKVLWQGGMLMNQNHTANLNEAISQQKNGIVLVFSLYRNGAAEDVSINSFFISKKEVELLDGAPHFFFLGINAGFSSLAGKYIYIYDNKLVGHEGNDDVGSSVISFNNSSYVLRYVIGV